MKIYDIAAGGRHPVIGAIWNDIEQRWTPNSWDMNGFFIGESWPRSIDLIGRI